MAGSKVRLRFILENANITPMLTVKHRLMSRALGMLLATCAAPAPALAESLNYAAAVDMALRQHPAMEASRARVAQAVAARAEADAARLPGLTLSETVSRSDDPLNVFGARLGQRVVDAADFVPSALNHPDAATDFNTRIELTYALYSGGRIDAGRKSATALLEAARSGDAAARQEIAFQVLAAYEGVHASRAGVAVASETSATAEAALKSAESLYRQGMGVKSDLLQARVAREEARLGEIEAGHALDAAYDRLRQWLGLAPMETLEIGPPLSPESLAADPEAQVPDSHPRLAALRHRLDASGAAMAGARAASLPSVHLMARQDWHDNQLGFDADAYTVAGMVSWKAFDGGAARAARDRARAGQDEARAELARARQELSFQLAEARRAEREAAARIASRTLAQEQADEARRLVLKRFENGLATMVEVQAARTQSARAQAELVAARYQHKLHRAAVLLAQGRMDPTHFTQESR